MNMIALEYARISFRAPIVHIIFRDDIQLGFNEIREITRYASSLSKGKPYYILADARSRVHITPLGLQTALDPDEAPLHRGTALWVRNEYTLYAENIFGALATAPFPYRVFTEKTPAVEWLYSIAFGEQLSGQNVRTA